MAAGNSTSQRRAVALKRQAECLELRRMGKGYAEIAATLGIAIGTAHKAVKNGLADARAQITASADELRTEELSRLDAMLGGLWPRARKGEVAAVDRVLKISERRAKLLGLEAPVRIESTGKDGGPIEVSSTATIDPTKLSTRTLQELLDARASTNGG